MEKCGAGNVERIKEKGGGTRISCKVVPLDTSSRVRSGSFIETLRTRRSEAASLDSLQPPAAYVYLVNNLVFLPTIVRAFRRMDAPRLRDLYDRARFKCAR